MNKGAEHGKQSPGDWGRVGAKKSLGQNFLKSRSVLADIVLAAELKSSDTVLEIGPGKGTLTASLLETGAKVIAVEKDDRLIPLLQEKFAKEIKSGRFELVHADILKISPSTLLRATSFKLVANIPYYITGQILRKFLTAEIKPELVVLMIQKEVALRIVGKDAKRPERSRRTKESLLSLSVKVYGVPKIIKTVPKSFFKPRPKVDSAILKISNISGDFFNLEARLPSSRAEQKFFEMIKLGFSSKRKMLLGNLKNFKWRDDLATKKVFEICGINEKARAEDLKIADWACLVEKSVDK